MISISKSIPKFLLGNQPIVITTLTRRFCFKPQNLRPKITSTVCSVRQFSSKTPGEDDTSEPWIPEFVENFNEPIEDKRARLIYQSRKRGMLENGLLFSTFAAEHLRDMNEEYLALYDRLINLPSNDWEIYYWVTGVKETPPEFDNNVMNMLKEHCKNKQKQMRIALPDLN